VACGRAPCSVHGADRLRSCSNCFDGPVFKTQKVVDCRACNEPLKKTFFSDLTKEEIDYERERAIRKDVLSKFNLLPEDFDSLEEYLDYQELAEQIVWNKLHREDVNWATEQIERNERENRTKIARRTADRAQALRRFRDEEKEEKARKREAMRLLLARERYERLSKQLEKAERNKVAIGEIRATTRAMREAEQELREREQRERDRIAMEQDGYGPQVLHLDQAALWPQHFLDAQPRPEKASFSHDALSVSDLRAARRLAGGFDAAAASRRAEQVMLAGLLSL